MNGSLYKHMWLSFKRSPLLTEKLGQTLVMALVGVYVLVSFLYLGLAGGELLKEHYAQYDIVLVGIAFIMYALIFSFLLRMMMQSFPNLHIQPYLILPISKGKVVNHLLIRSVFAYFNLLPIILIIPFALIYISPEVSSLQFWGLICFILGSIMFNHFLTFYLSKATVFNRHWVLLIPPLLCGLLWLDYEGYIPLLDILASTSQGLLELPWLGLIPLLMSAAILYMLRSDLLSEYRLVEDNGSISNTAQGYKFDWLDRYGKVGALLDLEIRLILRSKRAKGYLYMSILMMLYPLILGRSLDSEFNGVTILLSIFVSGAFSLNYGLYILAWNSLHFDLLLTRVVDYKDIFTAKFYLLAGSSLVITILAVPYVFWYPKFYLYIIWGSFFNMSIIPFFYLYISNYKSLKIDPNSGGAFSFNGIEATHWLVMIPIMIVPIILFYIGDSIGGEWFGIAFLGGIGIIGLIFHRSIIGWNTDIFRDQKYALSDAFKKQL